MGGKNKSKNEATFKMKKGINGLKYSLLPIFCAVALLSICLTVYPAEFKTLTMTSGDVFEFKYRELKPGEPLVVVWKEKNSDVIEIKFMSGEKFSLKRRPGQPEFLLLGIDLSVKPGIHTLEISAYRQRELVSRTELQVEILPREFPKKELTVEQKYVTPPRQVQERIKREAELLAEIYSLSSPEWLAGSSFVLPCEGKLFPNFGQQRIYNRVPRSVHSGVDIAVPTGHPIKATSRGRVVLASDLYFSGKTVIIDHGLGLFSTYCHLSRILVKRGDLVETGQVIGQAGSTGLSTGPHLHWAIRINEARIDPLSLLELEF